MESQVSRALHDAGALTRFLRELEPFVYRVCYHLIGEQKEAEELAEQALLRLCRQLRRYQEDISLPAFVCQLIWDAHQAMTGHKNIAFGRQLYVLRFVAGLSLPEIALLLGLRESDIKTRLLDLRQAIRLQDHNPYSSGGEAV